MRCSSCKKDVTKIDLKKAVVEYLQADGLIKAYGFDRPDGKPDWLGGHPTGSLLHAFHYKCYMNRLRGLERESLGHLTNLTSDAHNVNVATRDSLLDAAKRAQEITNVAKAAEVVHPAQPVYYETDQDDWRDQVVLEVSDLLEPSMFEQQGSASPVDDGSLHEPTHTGADSATG